MSLDERYFVTSDLDTYFVDKDTGLPLSGGFLTFYRDVARTTPKTVYQLTGAPPDYTYTALPNPIQLSGSGTVQNAGGDNVVIYYYPYDASGNLDLYYVVCVDSGDTMQFTREAWPNITAADNPTTGQFPIQNQLANPQFTQVFINENAPTVYIVSAATNEVFAFAPNWDFVISGTGTVTVERVAIAGNENVVTSPPYVIDVTVSAGITSCNLRQRLYLNSGLWASTADENIYLSGSLIARNENAGTSAIQMFYVESSGSPISIVDASFNNANYQSLTGVTFDPIPLSTDTNTDFAGYVDIYLSFLTGSEVRISSIQVVPTLNQAGATILQYDLNSSNREQALMGDYYIPRLNRRPAGSLLTGWDFMVNPFQFSESGTITNTAGYICDQTIALTGTSGAVQFVQDTVTNGLALRTEGNNDAFYLMQYLSGADATKMLGTDLSVNVFGYVTSASAPVTMSVYLFRASSSASIPILPTSIGTIATDGVFTLTASDWTEIPRSGLPTAQAVLPYSPTDSDINNLDNDMGFVGWKITDNTEISDTQYFAIVVTFAYIDISTTLTIQSISLIPSDIPSRPAPQSSDEVLRKCQYYFEKSYDLNVYEGDISNNGLIIGRMNPAGTLPNVSILPLSFSIYYNIRKRIPVNPIIIAPDGTVGSVFADMFNSGTAVISGDVPISGNWTQTVSGETGVLFQPIDQSVPIIGFGGSGYALRSEANIFFQFIADARLGIV